MKVYLEFHDQTSNKFWEITQEGVSHTVRYGRIDGASQSQTKEFPSVAQAMKDAQRLIASKRGKGYKDVEARTIVLTPVEPEMLDYEPISEEEQALFTQELLGEPAQRYWEKEMEVLTEGLEAQAKVAPHEDMALLAQEMETIASWSCPDMQKEVIRDGDGFAQRIIYSVNGVPTLWLYSGAWDDMGTRHSSTPMMCFAGDNSSGYFWLFGHRFVEDFRLVIERLTHFCAERIPTIEEKLQQKVKDQKIKQVADANIPMMVSSLLAGTGYEYNLDEGSKASKLHIKLGHERVVELNLPHKSFVKRAGDIVPTVARVAALLEELPQPILVGTRAGEISAEWGGVWHDTGAYSGAENFENKFWMQALEGYIMETLFGGDPPKTKTYVPLAEIAQWEFEGLGKDVDTYRGAVNQIQYHVEKEDVFYIDEDGLNIDLSEDPEPQGMDIWDLADDGNMPPLENWRAFLEGFVAFYHEQRKRMPSAEAEYRQELQLKEKGAKELEVAIRELFEGGEREWALDLYTVHYHHPGRLHLKVKGRKTLTVLFKYLNVSNTQTLENITSTIELVEKAIGDCKIPFKLFWSKSWEFEHDKEWQKA